MGLLVLFAVAALCLRPATEQSNVPLMDDPQATARLRSDNQQPAANAPSWPVQLEMRVPFEPTVFPNGPHSYVMYELHLTNFGTTALSLSPSTLVAASLPSTCICNREVCA